MPERKFSFYSDLCILILDLVKKSTLKIFYTEKVILLKTDKSADNMFRLKVIHRVLTKMTKLLPKSRYLSKFAIQPSILGSEIKQEIDNR